MRKRYGFLLVGYAVMPEHVHLLISEPKKGAPSTVLQVLKQRVSRQMRTGHRRERQEKTPPFTLRRAGHPPGRFWQPRFYDFNVWSAKKRKERLEYMHRNPVTRELVEDPKEWPWSSWWFYAGGEAGMLPIDPVE